MSKRKGQPTKNRGSARRASRAATRRRWPWLLLGLAVGAGIAVSIWLMRSSSSEPSSSTTLAASDLNWQPPNPSTQNMQPQVARVLREQREHLLNNIRSSQAWGELGRLYDAHDLRAAAEHCYRHAVALAPSNPQWAYLYAFCRDVGFADTEEVVELYERMLSLADYPPAAFRLGDALARRGRLEEARAAFARAIGFDPNFGMAHRSLGQTLLSLGDLPAAQHHLQRAQALLGEDGITHIALAQLYTRLGEPDLAQRAAQLAQTQPHVGSVPDPFRFQILQLAMAEHDISARAANLMSQGKYEDALVQLGYLREAHPGNAAVHFRIGLCNEQLGRHEDAIAAYRRAVQIDPEHQAAQRLAQLGG